MAYGSRPFAPYTVYDTTTGNTMSAIIIMIICVRHVRGLPQHVLIRILNLVLFILVTFLQNLIVTYYSTALSLVSICS